MRTQGDVRAEHGRGEPGARLSFIDHDRQRYAEKVWLPHEGEVLVGEYLEGGGTGPFGEFRIALHDLGRRGGLLLRLDAADLAGLLAPVADHAAMSRRLLALGVGDRSDAPLAGGPEAG